MAQQPKQSKLAVEDDEFEEFDYEGQYQICRPASLLDQCFLHTSLMNSECGQIGRSSRRIPRMLDCGSGIGTTTASATTSANP